MKEELLIDKWFGLDHPLRAQMLAMLLDTSSESDLLQYQSVSDEFELDIERHYDARDDEDSFEIDNGFEDTDLDLWIENIELGD